MSAPNVIEAPTPAWEESAPTPAWEESTPAPAWEESAPAPAWEESATAPSGVIGYVPVYTEPNGQRRQASAGVSLAHRWLRRLDLVIIVAALCAAHVYSVLRTFSLHTRQVFGVPIPIGHVMILLLCAYTWVAAYHLFGLYANRRPALPSELVRLALACVVGVLFTVAAHQPVVDALAYHGGVAFLSAMRLWGMVFILTAFVRTLRWGVASMPFTSPVRHVLIVGSGPQAVSYYRTLLEDSRRKCYVVGFVDTRRHPALTAIGATLIGRLHELETVLANNVVDEVYIALPLRSCYNEFQGAIHVCERVGVRAVYAVDAFDYRVNAPRYDHAGGVPVATITPVVGDAYLPVKRVVDVLVSGLALAILAPVLVCIVVLIMLTSPGPVLFAQERYGQHKRRFKLYKFRSMRVDAEEILRRDPVLLDEYRRNHFKLPEHRDPRLTPIGVFLRKTSLDELPQLWNVLRGDMSLIGPRPIVPAEIEHYGPFASLLLALKPGLAGAWVVQGRSAVGYPQRAEIELSYIRDWSLLRDAKILLRTIPGGVDRPRSLLTMIGRREVGGVRES